MANYDTAHNKAAHKYLLKVFYNKTNIKSITCKFGNIILYLNNIIAIKDVIIEEKIREKEGLLEDITDTNASAEVTLASNLVDLTEKYT